MRCGYCEYCRYDMSDDMYECLMGIEATENEEGLGCRFNKVTLKKLNRQYWEQESEDALAMSKYCEGLQKEGGK